MLENLKQKQIEVIEKINEITREFAKNHLIPLIGFEFEFYIARKGNASGLIEYCENLFVFNKTIIEKNSFFKKINQIFFESSFDGYLEHEVDQAQFEIISNPTNDPCSLFLKMNRALPKIEIFIKDFFYDKSLEICSLAKPFDAHPANGLHFHLSFQKIPSMENIFSQKHDFHPDLSNEFMAKVIGVMLHELKKNIKKFFPNESILRRILSPNKIFARNFPGITCEPTNFSWGKNNRTTAIRIPESLPESKRIEFRVPSSENDFFESLYFILKCSYVALFEFDQFLQENSLTQKNFLQPATFGLAFDKQYELEKFIDYILK